MNIDPDLLAEAMMSRGVKDGSGKVVSKYAFLKKKQIKKIKYLKQYKVGNTLLTIRIL